MKNLSQKPFFSVLVGLVSLFFFVSCQTPTPAMRIESNPALFQMLSPEHQAMVQQGKICEGMSQNAVFLAWGFPNSAPYEGQMDGKTITRWVYNRMEPVIVTDGPYWGPSRWYDPYTLGVANAYVPRNIASVVFENGKVVSWECRAAMP